MRLQFSWFRVNLKKNIVTHITNKSTAFMRTVIHNRIHKSQNLSWFNTDRFKFWQKFIRDRIIETSLIYIWVSNYLFPSVFLFKFSMHSLFPRTCHASALQFPVRFISHSRKLFTYFFYSFHSANYDTNITTSTNKMHTFL